MTNYALPSHTGIRSVVFRMSSQNFSTGSPFTYQQQVINHAGRRWEVDVTLPPMKHANARIWLAWLAKLDGSLNTFTIGDPLGCTAQGEAGGTPGSGCVGGIGGAPGTRQIAHALHLQRPQFASGLVEHQGRHVS